MPTDETKLALLEQRMEYLVKGFDNFTQRFEELQKSMDEKYMPRTELKTKFDAIEHEINEIKDEKKSNKPLIVAWVSAGISALMLVVTVVSVYLHK